MAVGRGHARNDRHAVLAEQIDGCAGHGLARADRVHEHVLRAVCVRFDEQPEIRDEHKSLVAGTHRAVVRPVPPLHANEVVASVG